METALQKLDKILELESQGGYLNRAVIGGVQKYIPVWIEEARDQAVTEIEKVLVEQIGEVLIDYGRLDGPGAREKMIGSIRAKLVKAIEASSLSVDSAPSARERTPKQPAYEKNSTREIKKEPPAKTTQVKPPDEFVTEPPKGLFASVVNVRGIGPSMADKLANLGIFSIYDLLTHFPRRYVDYSTLKTINRLEYADEVTIIGTIRQTSTRKAKGGQTIITSIISDSTGAIQCTWFNQPWLRQNLTAGSTVMISGKVDRYLGRTVMTSPEWEMVDREQLHTGRLVPIYPLTAGVSAKMMRNYVKRAEEYWARRVPDHLPADLLQRQRLMPLGTALSQIHFPDNLDRLDEAKKRLAFDELYFVQLGLMNQRREWQSREAMALRVTEEWLESFVSGLPFQLTRAQRRVLADVLGDITNETPMNRLLQGDVGSGKTIIAAAALAAAVEADSQATLMAPTEILAEQHARALQSLLPNVQVKLLTGSMSASDKQSIYDGLESGSIPIVVGTHALIQTSVTFKQLGLVVVDEQHRFGVEQRAALRQKGHNPHVLVMTATPIPRTLALTLYGDLDLSVIDEMPPGRQPVATKWIQPQDRERAYTYIRSQIEQGRQAFIICPLVESTENSEDKSAVEEYNRLQNRVFPGYKLGLLHGRLKGEEKEAAMQSFYLGKTNILVSTSVVEVGIDVPNATVMLVEGANRFGLAQLHQFRGRVGRGEHKSICLLLAESTTPEAKERLSALEATNDGFILAEKDLELRGPGEFLGTRQSGLPDLKMAQVTDLPTLEKARQEAFTLFEQDPTMEKPEHQLLSYQLGQFWSKLSEMS
ncbi:MAG: ATP-dependent DNA helicase RecG [Anaerolineales bacterium]|nr:ATP-dependent DNA helicase RecG [Anaerolineales bacterium]